MAQKKGTSKGSAEPGGGVTKAGGATVGSGSPRPKHTSGTSTTPATKEGPNKVVN